MKKLLDKTNTLYYNFFAIKTRKGKKIMKKFFAILMSLALMLSLAVPAMAANVTVTQTGHTYEAYQILTGSQNENEGALGNVAWGSGINSAGFLAALKEDATVRTVFTSATDAKTFAEALATLTDDSVGAKAVAAIADAHKTTGVELTVGENNLADGYYLIVDATSVTGQYDSKNASLLQVTRDITIADKSAKPEVDKQVWDDTGDDDNHEKGDNNWGETADHAINESFQFKLIADLPADEDFDAYETYKVVFTDTMSAGITFESIHSVTVDGKPVEKGDDITNYKCTAVEGTAGGKWTLTIENIKGISGVNLTDGAKVVVIYNAHLNENAVIGNIDDNLNKVYLEYSNNPNVGGENDLGKTPEDTVWVFTYEMKNTKTTGTGAKLEGATFAIKNEVGKYYGGVVNGVVTWVESENPVTDTSVYKVTSNDQGNFTVKGLDIGTYILTEIVTPAGYNTCADVTVVISATHSEKSATEAETVITMTKDGTSATEITVVNNSGATLPETGGMGTTIFYVVGGVMAAAAAILLITKKRLSNNA